MGHDPVRAGVFGGLALLLVCTAALFPVGGVGSYPAVQPAAGPAVEANATATPSPVASAGGEGNDADGTQTDTPTATPTATPTDTPTTATAPAAARGDGGIGGLGTAFVVVVLVASLSVPFLVAVGGVAARETRRPDVDLPGGRLPRVRVFVAAVPRATVAVLVATGSGVARLGSGVAAAVGGVGEAAVGVVIGLSRVVGAVGTGLTASLGAVSLPSVSGLASGVSVSRPTGNRGSERTDRRRPSDSDSGPEPASESSTSPETVREAWAVLPASVPGQLSDVDTMTPGELARRARERGLPADPVETLTDAFRRVRYADGVDDRRRSAALAAFARLREAVGDGDESRDDGGGGS